MKKFNFKNIADPSYLKRQADFFKLPEGIKTKVNQELSKRKPQQKKEKISIITGGAGWFWLPNYLYDHLSQHGVYTISVFIALLKYADSNSRCFPGCQTIANDFNISIRQVYREIKLLEKIGRLKIDKKPGRANHYILNRTTESWTNEY